MGSSATATVSIRDHFLRLEKWREDYGNDLRTLYIDPQFVSIEGENVMPAENSPAVDAGADMQQIRSLVNRFRGLEWILAQLDSMETTDPGGHIRPAGEGMDIGALEGGGVFLHCKIRILQKTLS